MLRLLLGPVTHGYKNDGVNLRRGSPELQSETSEILQQRRIIINYEY